MTFDLWMLAGAILLGLVHAGAQSFTYKAQVGNAYTVGARDEVKPATGVAGRLERALRNFIETFPLFVAAIVLVHLSGTYRAGGIADAGAALYLFGRAVYLPLYAAGIPNIRTVFWQVASVGIVLVTAQIFF
ncbi:MAG: hypothetical protein GC166_02335 [Alphaproteobacteria bacterium]|nr:hypothetical protein [Alphaproteobacteria bacterium]